MENFSTFLVKEIDIQGRKAESPKQDEPNETHTKSPLKTKKKILKATSKNLLVT